ncbi:MAG: glycosyltransferase family 2 protein [Paraprevotella sp.]|nr:glycosyltransferase family 2 protein [Paraprevotella sp.]
MDSFIIKKVLRALCDFPKSFRRIRHPKLVLTLLVKNEEETLEWSLLFHKAMGVDAFIITDNGSTDATPAIVEKYRKKRWVVDSIVDPMAGHYQKELVDRMIWKAKTIFHADWIINADGDEFWYAPSGNIKNELSRTWANVLSCEMRVMYPDENKPFWAWNLAVRSVPSPEDYGLPSYSLFGRQLGKVIHRADGYLQITAGNHKVRMLPWIGKHSYILIYHYTIRSRRHFVEKMVNGGRQMELHKGRHGGRHWRYCYQLYKEGRLDEEYDRVLGREQFPRLKQDGYVFEDPVPSKIFECIRKDGE